MYTGQESASSRLMLLGLICLGLSSCSSKEDEFKSLVKEHATAAAHVSVRNCENHGAYYYTFSVGSHKYANQALANDKRCGDVKVGDPITVYYSPKNPGINTDLAPTEAYARTKGLQVPWWVVFFTPLLIGVSQLVYSIMTDSRKKN